MHPTARRQRRLGELLATARACLSSRPADNTGARLALEEAIRIRGVIWPCDPRHIRMWLKHGQFAALRRYLCPAAACDEDALFTVPDSL